MFTPVCSTNAASSHFTPFNCLPVTADKAEILRWSGDSSVNEVIYYGLDERALIPDKGRLFSFSHRCF
jgi:hypothetical protein